MFICSSCNSNWNGRGFFDGILQFFRFLLFRFILGLSSFRISLRWNSLRIFLWRNSLYRLLVKLRKFRVHQLEILKIFTRYKNLNHRKNLVKAIMHFDAALKFISPIIVAQRGEVWGIKHCPQIFSPKNLFETENTKGCIPLPLENYYNNIDPLPRIFRKTSHTLLMYVQPAYGY